MSLRQKIPGFGAPDHPVPSEVALRVPLDSAFHMFANKRRAQTIRFLARMDAGEGVSLRLIAERVAARENGVPMSELDDDQIKRVYVGLYQTHIEKLAALGLLQYDDETGVLYSTRETEEAVRFLDVNRPMAEDRT